MITLRGKSRGSRCHFQLTDDRGHEVVLDLDWKQASEMLRQMITVQRAAEEYAHANQIIGDAALLLRTGAPFGLSNDPRILSASQIEAAHNRDLRRYLPGGVKSREQFGRPIITNGDA